MKNFLSKTKGSYPLSSRDRGKKRYVLLTLVIVFLVLSLGRTIVGKIGGIATAPFFSIRHYIETSSATIPVFLRSRIELDQRIANLEQQVSSQDGTEVLLAQVTAENTELRNLLGGTSTPHILAGVIARPPFMPYDTIMLDRGSGDGVVEFAPVVEGRGIAIGYVRTVFPHRALVSLFSSPGIESTVYVYGPNIFTTAYGEGGGVIRLSVPQGITVEKGNAVVLQSLDGGSLGTVSSVESIPTEPEQRAYITYPIPLQSMHFVSVGVTPIKPTTYEDARLEIEKEAQKRISFTIPAPQRIEFGTSTTSTPPLYRVPPSSSTPPRTSRVSSTTP